MLSPYQWINIWPKQDVYLHLSVLLQCQEKLCCDKIQFEFWSDSSWDWKAYDIPIAGACICNNKRIYFAHCLFIYIYIHSWSSLMGVYWSNLSTHHSHIVCICQISLMLRLPLAWVLPSRFYIQVGLTRAWDKFSNCRYIYIYVCLYVCVRMYGCMDVCMYVCMYVCMFLWCVYVFMMCVCLCVCLFACLYVCMFAYTPDGDLI